MTLLPSFKSMGLVALASGMAVLAHTPVAAHAEDNKEPYTGWKSMPRAPQRRLQTS